MEFPTYLKLVCFEEPHLTYYVRKDLVDEWGTTIWTRMAMAMADFVINHRTNEFIKCRYTLEDLLDALSMIGAERDVAKKQHE